MCLHEFPEPHTSSHVRYEVMFRKVLPYQIFRSYEKAQRKAPFQNLTAIIPSTAYVYNWAVQRQLSSHHLQYQHIFQVIFISLPIHQLIDQTILQCNILPQLLHIAEQNHHPTLTENKATIAIVFACQSTLDVIWDLYNKFLLISKFIANSICKKIIWQQNH